MESAAPRSHFTTVGTWAVGKRSTFGSASRPLTHPIQVCSSSQVLPSILSKQTFLLGQDDWQLLGESHIHMGESHRNDLELLFFALGTASPLSYLCWRKGKFFWFCCTTMGPVLNNQGTNKYKNKVAHAKDSISRDHFTAYSLHSLCPGFLRTVKFMNRFSFLVMRLIFLLASIHHTAYSDWSSHPFLHWSLCLRPVCLHLHTMCLDLEAGTSGQ